MKKILHVISSAKSAQSYSTQLSFAVVQKLTEQYKENYIVTRDLGKSLFPHLQDSEITSFFTPPPARTKQQQNDLNISDEAIKELLEADVIVLAVPMYNFTIPSTLKAWIDHVARVGVTFNFTETGTIGLIDNKKVYLCISSGGIYSEGPGKKNDFTEPYLRAILGFLGITDITTFRVEGVAIPGMAETALDVAIENIQTAPDEVKETEPVL